MEQVKQILVVEDDADISDVLANILTDEGYRVVCSENGKQALEWLSNEQFHLITLDLKLPDMNGNEFLNELSKRSLNQAVVVVSANANYLKPNPLVRAVVPKPFDIQKLLNTIEQHV